MKLSLSANISKLRKEHAMTQEQLAEALGVTFASVSKWERGVATPELNLIAEMADCLRCLSMRLSDTSLEIITEKL
ncbi:MAG: helix-turn-helix transcriptional regulator [Ruminococcus sp.]